MRQIKNALNITNMNLALAVCGLHEVSHFVQAGLTDLVSIGDPDGYLELCSPQQAPDFTLFLGVNIHRFEFQDIAHEAITSPTKVHIERLIAIADDMIARPNDVRVLFHCMAGVSRSTAAAFILCVREGMTYQQAYDYIVRVRGVINPNLLMIKYADELMNQGGKMLEFIVTHRWGGPDPDAIEWARKNGYTF